MDGNITHEDEGGLLVPVPSGTELSALFSQREAVDAILAKVRAAVMSEAPDLTSAKGRKRIASLAYSVARSKTALDEAGKSLTSDLRAKINAVDVERRRIRDELDALKLEVRAPLDEWEKAEEARVARHRQAVADIAALAEGLDGASSEAIRGRIDAAEAVVIGPEWEEFAEIATDATIAALDKLRAALKAAQEREEQQARLERLEAELAEQRRQAEELRRAQAEAEAEARRAREEAEARARAEREAEAARQREAELARLRQEQEAERRRQEAERLERARIEAAQRERDRIEAEAARKRAEEERRAQSARIRNRVRREIAHALEGLSPEQAADALIDGKVPHATVRF